MHVAEIQSQMLRQKNGPLVFFHIPKTAGTSLIQALRNLKPWAHRLTGPPFLSKAVMVQAAALPRSALPETIIYGHPLAGVFELIQNGTLVTVVREPAAHAVSHYLFTQRRPEIPLHAESLTMNFTDFVRKHWQYLVYQSISLGISDSLKCDSTQAEFQHSVPRIRDIFRRMDIVGTTDDLAGFVGKLARTLDVPSPRIERLNQATEEGISSDQIAQLRQAYGDLRRDPELAWLLACEEELYAMARQRGAVGL